MTPETDQSWREQQVAFYRTMAENERRAGVKRLEKYLADNAALRKQISELKAELRKVRDENKDLKRKLGAVYRFVPKSVLRSAWARFGNAK